MRETLEETLGEHGRLSRGEAGLVTELVVEHGQVHVLAELRLALNAICAHGTKLTTTQAQTLTKLLLKHGDVDMAKVRVLRLSLYSCGGFRTALGKHLVRRCYTSSRACPMKRIVRCRSSFDRESSA